MRAHGDAKYDCDARVISGRRAQQAGFRRIATNGRQEAFPDAICILIDQKRKIVHNYLKFDRTR
jgi:hypothetical protein